MKKNFKKLVLNKSTLSNLENNEIIGGDVLTKPPSCKQTCGQQTCNTPKKACAKSWDAACVVVKTSIDVKCLPG